MEKFEIVSGTLVCSDPCYSIPTWCQGIVENVKKGTWVADVEEDESWGRRIAELRINHVNHFLSGKFEEMPFSAGVDSGQFGFFDKEFYRNDEKAKELKKHNFGLRMPDLKLPRVTIGPRAVCCACLDKYLFYNWLN